MEWSDQYNESLKHCIELLQKDSVQELFTNYEYDEDHIPKRKIPLRIRMLKE